MRFLEIVSTARRIGEKWAGVPGIEITRGGRLFVVWFSGGECEPRAENKIFMTVSDDDGVTFSAPCVMASPIGEGRAFDPALWLDPSGLLWFFFNRGDAETGEHGVHARTCANPDEASPTWSDEIRIGFDVPYSSRLNKPTVLSTGEWLLPVTYADEATYAWFPPTPRKQGAAISVDQGKTWTLHGAVEAPRWAQENMFIERRDGSVQMYIRTGAGFLWKSLSRDKGQTWTAGEASDIINPGSRFYIRKLADGDWLLINSPLETKRTEIIASLSSDEGETWSTPVVLDPRANTSYPDAAISAKGVVYSVHDRDRCGAGEILLSVFEKSDL